MFPIDKPSTSFLRPSTFTNPYEFALSIAGIFNYPFPVYTDPGAELYAALGMTMRTLDPGPKPEKPLSKEKPGLSKNVGPGRNIKTFNVAATTFVKNMRENIKRINWAFSG